VCIDRDQLQDLHVHFGNATGCIVFSTGELDAKRLDLMREIVPGASVFGVLVNPKFPPATNQRHALEAAATKTGRTIFVVEASDDAELEAASRRCCRRASAVLWSLPTPSSTPGARVSSPSRRKTFCPASTNSVTMPSTAASSATARASRKPLTTGRLFRDDPSLTGLRTWLDLPACPARSRLLRVSDAGRSRRRGVHRGRRPKAFNERNRGKWQGVVPRALWGFARGRRTG
jgi:hypothetical protein